LAFPTIFIEPQNFICFHHIASASLVDFSSENGHLFQTLQEWTSFF
jgi:hypothetical protein